MRYYFFFLFFFFHYSIFAYSTYWRPLNIRFDCQTISVGDGNIGLGINFKTEKHFGYSFRMGVTPVFIWNIFDDNMKIYREKYVNQNTDTFKNASSTFGLSGQMEYYFLSHNFQPFLYAGFSSGQMYFGPYSWDDTPAYSEGFMTTINFGIGTEYHFLKQIAIFGELGIDYPFGLDIDFYYSQKDSFFSRLIPTFKIGVSFH